MIASMSDCAQLFVYGLLLPGFQNQNQVSQLLHRHAESLGPAKCPGQLYSCGDYPAALFSRSGPESFVHGQLLCVTHELLAALAQLDQFEGSEYRRVLVEVQLTNQSGPSQQAWAYEYVLATPDLPLIEHGDFVRHWTDQQP